MGTVKPKQIVVFALALVAAGAADGRSLAGVSLQALTEQTDVWVRGRLSDVVLRPLPPKEQYKFNHEGNVEVTAHLHVLTSTPPLDAPDIVLHTVT